MKRILSTLLALVMFVSVFTVSMSVSAKTECEYKIENGEVTITSYYTRDKVIEIPAEIEGYPVTKLARESFAHLPNVEKIVVPSTVKEIETDAFVRDIYLREVILPENEMIFAGGSFVSTRVKNFDIPKTWTAIPAAMFYCASELETVNIPNGVKEIGELAFAFCKYFSNISIPDSVESIGEFAFEGTQIRALRLPSQLKVIEKGVLNIEGENRSLELLAVPKSVTEIKANSGITTVKEIYYEGTKEDWDKIKKDKATANAELNIVFEKYPSEEEMPKLEPLFTPAPTPVPTPDPLELKLNALILDFEANTENFDDQSGRAVFKGVSTNEKYNGHYEFTKDEETGLNVLQLNNAMAEYYLYYLQDVRDNFTLETYFKINRDNTKSAAPIARLGEFFSVYEDIDSDCVPDDLKGMEPIPSWICLSGAVKTNKVGLGLKGTIDNWIHVTYVRKGDTEYFYVNGTDVTNGGVKIGREPDRLSWAFLGEFYYSKYFSTEEYLAFMRVYAGAASPEWVKKMYDNRNTPYDPKNPTVPTIEGETVVGVQEETTKETLMDFVYDSENSDIVTCEGTALAPTALVGTGAKLKSDGDEYSVVVKKDVSGDGKISSIDYLKLKKHFSGNTLSGIYQKAGDSNCDDRITSADYLLIKRYFAAK